MEEEKDVSQDSSPELEQALESASPAQEQQTQEAQSESAEQSVTQEQEEQQEKVGFGDARHPDHERFQQLQEREQEAKQQANWYKQQLETQLQQRQSQQQFQQPQATDPYAHLAPEEARWYRERDKQVDERVQKGVEKYVNQNVRPILDAGRMEVARVTVADFRRTHPDIKANSPDELAIAEKINTGYNPEDAYWSIMGPHGVQRAEGKVKQQFKKTFEAKKKANVESSGMPAKTGLPGGKQTTRQRAENAFSKLTVEEREALGF